MIMKTLDSATLRWRCDACKHALDRGSYGVYPSPATRDEPVLFVHRHCLRSSLVKQFMPASKARPIDKVLSDLALSLGEGEAGGEEEREV